MTNNKIYSSLSVLCLFAIVFATGDALAAAPSVPSTGYVQQLVDDKLDGDVVLDPDSTASATTANNVLKSVEVIDEDGDGVVDDAVFTTGLITGDNIADGTITVENLSSEVTNNLVNISTTETGAGNMVTGVSEADGVITVTKGNVQIPVGGYNVTDSYAVIWVE